MASWMESVTPHVDRRTSKAVDMKHSPDRGTSEKCDVFIADGLSPVLSKKMCLVNDAIDEIGYTMYHTKLFVLCGFGYAVDSLILLLQSITADQAAREFDPFFVRGLTVAAYTGMLVGALFWGSSADIIGRKFAFNASLLMCSIFAIIAGSSPSWIVLGLWVSLSSFGAGGNLVLDTAVFLEYLPSKHQWLLTLLASWWGIGQLIAGSSAWIFIPRFGCPESDVCDYENNKGWRYVWYTCGTFVLILSLLRITILRLKETPKFLLGEGRDEEVIETLHSIASKYDRPCSIKIETLRACDQNSAHLRVDGCESQCSDTHTLRRPCFVRRLLEHIKGLYATKRIGFSTSLIWSSWLLIGLAYPLYNVFLPQYLASRGAQFGEPSIETIFRNYAFINLSGIFGPVLASLMCTTILGRKFTLVIGALLTMVFLFCFTQVGTVNETIGFNCAISFCLNIYYATLYAYTPEVIPSVHRGTGNGIAVGINRITGIFSAIVATEADTNTSVPIFICGSLYVMMAIVASLFPFEPRGKRSL